LESYGDWARLLFELLAGRPYRFYEVGEGLAGASKPTSLRALRWLRRRGFALLISLTVEPPNRAKVHEAGLEHHHMPIKNHQVPSLELLERIAALIDEGRSRGLGVVVHCSAGQGRSGTALAYYLWSRRGYGMQQAITHVRKACPGAIEPHQEALLKAWANSQGRP